MHSKVLHWENLAYIATLPYDNTNQTIVSCVMTSVMCKNANKA